MLAPREISARSMYAFDYGKLERAIGALTARGVKSLNKVDSERFGIASHQSDAARG